MEQTITTKYQYSKHQVGILTKAMLIAGLCFIVICGAAYGFSELFYRNAQAMLSAWRWSLPIFLLVMLVGMIISMLWVKALSQKKSTGLTVFIYLLYISLMSVAFGYIFALVRYSFSENEAMKYLAIAFGVTGGIFLIAAGMSKLLSIKGAFTFGRLIAGCAFAMSILMIVALTLGIVGSCSRSVGILSLEVGIFNFIMIGLSFAIFGYMVLDMWQISKSEEFMGFMGAEGEVPSSYVWYCGYKLLTDLLNLLLIVIWFILRFAKRS